MSANASGPSAGFQTNGYAKQYAAVERHHVEFLQKRAVLPEVSRERGYRTITVKARLAEKGFSLAQSRVPGLLIPLFNARGEPVGYQYRPDEPRVNSGKAVKYESPSKSRPVVDVPRRLSLPRKVDQLSPFDPTELPPPILDVTVPLLITEGAPKADAAVGIGFCSIALLGVSAWHRLPDWNDIPIKGRAVLLCFDSDAMQKRAVWIQLRDLREWFESHDAEVKIIYLPPAQYGAKTGLDDFIAAAKSAGQSDDEIRAALLALATDELREIGGNGKTTSDVDAMEAAIRCAETAIVPPIRAQYLGADGGLVYAVPLADKLALVKSDGTVELIEEPDPLVLPSRSTFTPSALKRYLSGETVGLTDLLHHLTRFIGERIVLKLPWHARLVALWVLGTYLHAIFRYYGYVHARSPAKRSGKSVLLELISVLSFNGSNVGTDPTPAVIFRDSNRNAGTQIFDEMENLRADKEKWGAVIAILNVGFKRGAKVPRVLDPKTDTLRDFDVYSPKAIASISHLPDTTADRVIPIELRRKLKTDKTKRLGTLETAAEASRLREDCHIVALRFAADVSDCYEHTEELPMIPEDLDDRARDILEPLFAIAAVADGESEQQAHYPVLLDAAKALSGFRASAESNELNLIAAAKALLDYDDREVFAVTTSQAFALFKQTDDLQWLDGDGGAQSLLRRLGFRSGSHRRELFRETSASSNEVMRGYRISRAELDDFVNRYGSPGEFSQ